jgi:hypothetical protein
VFLRGCCAKASKTHHVVSSPYLKRVHKDCLIKATQGEIQSRRPENSTTLNATFHYVSKIYICFCSALLLCLGGRKRVILFSKTHHTENIKRLLCTAPNHPLLSLWSAKYYAERNNSSKNNLWYTISI